MILDPWNVSLAAMLVSANRSGEDAPTAAFRIRKPVDGGPIQPVRSPENTSKLSWKYSGSVGNPTWILDTGAMIWSNLVRRWDKFPPNPPKGSRPQQQKSASNSLANYWRN
jgi:hypothetical protein